MVSIMVLVMAGIMVQLMVRPTAVTMVSLTAVCMAGIIVRVMV